MDDNGPGGRVLEEEADSLQGDYLTQVIPTEVQLFIFGFIRSLPDLLRLSCVNKYLFQLINAEMPSLISEIGLHRVPHLSDKFLMTKLLAGERGNLFRPRKLSLAGCYQISPSTFRELIKNPEDLEELNLAGCYQLFTKALGADTSVVKAYNNAFRNLHTLNLAGCCEYGYDSLNPSDLFDGCTRLTSLNLSGFQFQKKGLDRTLTCCPNIQVLRVCNVHDVTEDVVKDVIATRLSALRILDISNCHEVRASTQELLGSLSSLVFFEHLIMSNGEVPNRLAPPTTVAFAAPSDPRLIDIPMNLDHLQQILDEPLIDLNTYLKAYSRGRYSRHWYEPSTLLMASIEMCDYEKFLKLVDNSHVLLNLPHWANPRHTPLTVAIGLYASLSQAVQDHKQQKLRGRPRRTLEDYSTMIQRKKIARDTITTLLDRGAFAFSPPSEVTVSAWQLAIKAKDLGLLKELVEKGKLDMTKEGSKDNSPIQVATAKQPMNTEIVNYLLRLGADPFPMKNRLIRWRGLRSHWRNRFEPTSPFLTVLKQGNKESIEIILDKWKPPIDKVYHEGDEFSTVKRRCTTGKATALVYAAYHGNEATVEGLIEGGHLAPFFAKHPDFKWRSPHFDYTMYPEHEGYYPLVSLVKHIYPGGYEDPPPVDFFAVDAEGNTFLQSNIVTLDVNMVAILLENKIGLNVKNKYGDTAAHILMRNGKYVTVDGETELSDYHSVVLQMLHKYKFDFNMQNDKGATVLHMATNNSDARTVEYLVDNYKRLNKTLKDKRGLTPLQLAVGKKQPVIVELLLNSGGINPNDGVSTAAMNRFVYSVAKEEERRREREEEELRERQWKKEKEEGTLGVKADALEYTRGSNRQRRQVRVDNATEWRDHDEEEEAEESEENSDAEEEDDDEEERADKEDDDDEEDKEDKEDDEKMKEKEGDDVEEGKSEDDDEEKEEDKGMQDNGQEEETPEETYIEDYQTEGRTRRRRSMRLRGKDTSEKEDEEEEEEDDEETQQPQPRRRSLRATAGKTREKLRDFFRTVSLNYLEVPSVAEGAANGGSTTNDDGGSSNSKKRKYEEEEKGEDADKVQEKDDEEGQGRRKAKKQKTEGEEGAEEMEEEEKEKEKEKQDMDEEKPGQGDGKKRTLLHYVAEIYGPDEGAEDMIDALLGPVVDDEDEEAEENDPKNKKKKKSTKKKKKKKSKKKSKKMEKEKKEKEEKKEKKKEKGEKKEKKKHRKHKKKVPPIWIDPNAQMEGGDTALHLFARRGRFEEVVALLVRYPAVDPFIGNDKGELPLSIFPNPGVMKRKVSIMPPATKGHLRAVLQEHEARVKKGDKQQHQSNSNKKKRGRKGK